MNQIQKLFWRRYCSQSVQQLRSRLLYQSQKRGTLENGILLGTFAKKYVPSMTETQLRQYDSLISSYINEWDIFYWATGKLPVPNEYQSEVMELFIKHVKELRQNKYV